MTGVQENILLSPQARMREILEEEKPYALYGLVGVVSFVAITAFGFLVAGLAGIAIAAPLGVLIPIAALQYFLPIDHGEDLLRDPDISWIQGVPSALFAQQLAIGRTMTNTQALSFVEWTSSKHAIWVNAIPRNIFSLGQPTSAQRMNPTKIITSISNQPPFNLEEELQKAYTLPKDARVSNRTDPSDYLQELKDIVGRVLQYGVSVEQKQKLQQHFSDTLLPIFDSVETLFTHLDSSLENRLNIRQARARHNSSSIAQENNATLAQQYRQKVNSLLQLFSLVNPIEFNDLERDLINYPCPLVFASTKVIPIANNPLSTTLNTEGPSHFVQTTSFTPLSLGQDLQYIYTTEKDIPRVKAIVEPFGVEVRDLATLCYFED